MFLFILTFSWKEKCGCLLIAFSLEDISRDNCLDHGKRYGAHRHAHETRFNGQLERTSKQMSERLRLRRTDKPTEPKNQRTINERNRRTGFRCISFFFLMAPKWDTQTPLDPRLLCACVCVCGLCWFLHFGYVRSFGNWRQQRCRCCLLRVS